MDLPHSHRHKHVKQWPKPVTESDSVLHTMRDQIRFLLLQALPALAQPLNPAGPLWSSAEAC